MTDPPPQPELSLAVALAVTEDDAEVHDGTDRRRVRFAPPFPTPRTERVHPGHLVAVATTSVGEAAIVWRWFDAVVLGAASDGAVQLWEPAHGVIVARLRDPHATVVPGRRVQASAGLPGADWWAVVPRDADPRTVEPSGLEPDLAAIGRLYSEHGLWTAVFSS